MPTSRPWGGTGETRASGPRLTDVPGDLKGAERAEIRGAGPAGMANQAQETAREDPTKPRSGLPARRSIRQTVREDSTKPGSGLRAPRPIRKAVRGYPTKPGSGLPAPPSIRQTVQGYPMKSRSGLPARDPFGSRRQSRAPRMLSGPPPPSLAGCTAARVRRGRPTLFANPIPGRRPRRIRQTVQGDRTKPRSGPRAPLSIRQTVQGDPMKPRSGLPAPRPIREPPSAASAKDAL